MPNVSPVPKPSHWFVDILLEEPNLIRTRYSIGPFVDWTTARGIAQLWESEFGKDTTAISCRAIDDVRHKNRGRPPSPRMTS